MTTMQPDPLLEAYVLRVGAALGDVEPTERHALLADLRLHLDEVGRDDARPLDDIVGPPEVYAEELRAAVGLAAPDPAPAARPGPPRAPTAAAWPWVASHLAGAWRTIARAGRDVHAAVREAAVDGPAWWLLRAYLAVHVLGAVTGSEGAVLVPRVLHERVWGLVALFVAAVASVRLGRDPDRVPRRVVQIVSVLVVVIGVIAVVQADRHHDPVREVIFVESAPQRGDVVPPP
ncbi:hypothetical protein HC251_16610 [Iamia sp. SCSIO 61187]|uniref:hypothetical protein n=1 Tax=Iamia sp. SCSIO 61187 TaxID=2722752 RepID=UPI001C62A48B|nr:hypothetical protein [Iamia sp. SCSIO 61187]QYG93890.1 hypothetical protein HC251_16610 [Iamia sp. SCSIO 61187]